MTRCDDEHQSQTALFAWAEYVAYKYPELGKGSKRFFAVPNGGKRDIKTAVKLKAEGVKAGVWDVFLLVARGGYHGLIIELKANKNTLTKEQECFKEQVSAEGYLCLAFWDWQKASEAITNYLDGVLQRA